jgi:hypothetical protein
VRGGGRRALQAEPTIGRLLLPAFLFAVPLVLGRYPGEDKTMATPGNGTHSSSQLSSRPARSRWEQ